MSHTDDQPARDAETQAGPQTPAGARPGSAAQAAPPQTAQPQTTQTAQTAEATQTIPATRQETSQYVPRPTQSFDDAGYAEPRPEGAVLGFSITAAVLMMVSGLWNFLEGLAAIIRGSFFVTLPHYVYNVSITGWGWIHLIVGAAVFVAGVFLFMDKLWARIVGIALACISAVLNFLYIPYSPVWSVVVIAIDVVIVWALLSPRTRYARQS